MRCITHASYSQEMPARGQTFVKPSQTIPGMVPSLRDLIERYTRGEGIEQFNPVYTDSDLIPDNLERMDVFERMQYSKDLKESIAFERQKLGRAKAEKTAEPNPVPEKKPEEKPVEKVDS